ncbi:lycopene cyclase domain-containing protein [Dactylosporangium sp. CA-139114]|uniref:lycopene cyclase domain-containing protein n=1 Tax=Dactylosporangium sp. CA-139114 TaxID=3239931 RepID=UPI003D99A8B5
MTYTVAAVVGVLAALVLDVAVLRTRVVLGRVFWCSYPIVVVFQLLSNGILTGRGVVLYNPSAILGVRLAHAPVEDLLFGFALVLATLALWVFFRPRAASPPPPGPSGPREPRP